MACGVCPLLRGTPSRQRNGTGSLIHRSDKELCSPAVVVLSGDQGENSSDSASDAPVGMRVLILSLCGQVHFTLIFLIVRYS